MGLMNNNVRKWTEQNKMWLYYNFVISDGGVQKIYVTVLRDGKWTTTVVF